MASSGSWVTRGFVEGAAGAVQLNDTRADGFSPVLKIIVSDGDLYAKTWGSDSLPASLTVEGGDLLIKPRYLDWLETDDAIARAAERVRKYSGKDTRNLIVFDGGCASPRNIRVSVEKIMDGRRDIVGTVFLSKDE